METKKIDQRNYLLKLCLTVLFFSLFGFSQNSYAQNIEIKGAVKDGDGLPLPGVSVLVRGTTNGTQTDFDGNYTISVAKGDVLVFSYIGMKSQLITVADKTNIDVVLQSDAQALNEVVVVGFGTQRRADLTGSVGSIGASEIQKRPITSPDQALSGTIAGVNITNRSGDPGAPITVRIRGIGTAGVNDPLWVIDGVPLVQTSNITVNTSSTTDSNPLAGINSNDIESIDVLKDAASTAIYGARASNGVIIVTTKRGKSGKAKVTYGGYVTSSEVRDTRSVLNVEEYIAIQGELGRDVSQFSGQPFVDWQDEVFKDGYAQNHDVTVSGGNDNANYLISASYLDNEGIELAQHFTRYSFRANSDIKSGRFKFGESIAISQTDRLVQSEDAIFAGFNAALNAPFFKVLGDGPFGYNLENPSTRGDGFANNLVFRTDERVNRTTIQNRKLLANLYGEVEIISGLKFKESVAIDYNVGSGDFFQAKTTYDGNSERQSLLVQERPIEFTLTYSSALTYIKSFGDHHLSALIGFERTDFQFDKVRLQGRDLFNDNFAGSGSTVSGANEADRWILQGWLGRLTYDYKGKYLATFNVRRDATSRFSKDNRDDIFPSVSVGWRISEEDFFPKNKFIDNIKIRASWGESGNQFTGLNFAFLSALNNNIFYVVGNDQNVVVAPAPTTFANADLKWEISNQYDIGIDASFMKGKLTATLDYYDKTTRDVLLGLPIPFASGLFLPAESNVGNIENSGIEAAVSYNGKIGDFNFSIGGNITTVKNVVNGLGDIPEIISGIGGAQSHRTVVGQSLGHFFGFKTDGLYQNEAEASAALPDVFSSGAQPGDIRFVDINNDGKIDANDKTNIGHPFPKFYYGINLNGDYKGFDLSVSLRGAGDQQIFNSARITTEGLTGANNFSRQVLGRWTGAGTTNSASHPRLTRDDPNGNNRLSDRWIEDASFLRIQNIQFGYSFSSEKLKSVTKDLITDLRFYIGVQNLAVITRYSGPDPEVGRTQSFQKGDFTLASGQDGGGSPQPRVFQAGWTISF